VAKKRGDKSELVDLNPDDAAEFGSPESDMLGQQAMEQTEGTDSMALAEPTDSPEEPEEEEPKGGLLAWLGRTSPYTVLLFMALVAMGIAAACLYVEWERYGKDNKARAAKQVTIWAAPSYAGPANIIANA